MMELGVALESAQDTEKFSHRRYQKSKKKGFLWINMVELR